MLLNSHKVGENLARVVFVAERVHHGHARVCRHLFEPSLGVGAPDDSGDLTVEHAGGVGNRLLAGHLTGLGIDDQRSATEVGNADTERDSGARRGLVEDQRDGLRACIRVLAVWRLLKFVGKAQNGGLLGRCHVIVF